MTDTTPTAPPAEDTWAPYVTAPMTDDEWLDLTDGDYPGPGYPHPDTPRLAPLSEDDKRAADEQDTDWHYGEH